MNILKELKRIDLKDLKLFYIKKPLFTKMSYLEETDIFRTEETDFKVTLDESSKELESYLSKVKVERPKLNDKKIAKDFNFEDTSEYHYKFYCQTPIKYFKLGCYLDDNVNYKYIDNRKYLSDKLESFNEDDMLINVAKYDEDCPTIGWMCDNFAVNSDYYTIEEVETFAFEGKYIDDQSIYLEYLELIINTLKEHNYEKGYYIIDELNDICLEYEER